MRKTKRALSLVLAAMMIISMLVVGTVVASAAATVIKNKAGFLNAIANGGEYKLGANINVSGSDEIFFDSDTKLTIDSAQYKLNLGDNVLVNKKEIELSSSYNGGFYANERILRNYGKATLSGNFYSVAPQDNTCAIYNGKTNYPGDATTAISPRVSLTFTGNLTAARNGIMVYGYTDFTFDKGSIVANHGYALCGNGNPGNGGYKITVKGGEITSVDDLGIYQCNDGTLTVTGGTITGTTALYIKSGTTNISGGSFIATGEQKAYSAYQNGGKATGDAVVIDYDQGYVGHGPTAIKITGGTFESENSAAISNNVRTGNDRSDAAAQVQNFVSGGAYSTDVAEFLAEGSSTTTVDGVKYVGDSNFITNADELFAACAAGGKYILKNNITLVGHSDYLVESDIEIIGNGYTLTCSNNVASIFCWHNNPNAKVILTDAKLDGNNTAENAVYTPAYGRTNSEQNKNENALVKFTNVEVYNFKGFQYVGAVYLFSHSKGEFTNCNFHDNSTPELDEDGFHGSDIWGGAATTNTISGGTFSDSVFVNGGSAHLTAKDNAQIASVEVFAMVDEAPSFITNEGATITETKAMNTKIDSYQKKTVKSTESTSEEGNDINTKGVRIIVKADKDFLDTCSDYGFVVAKYTGNKAQADLDFSVLNTTSGNGQKVISCKDSVNSGLGLGENYVTLAVNNMNSGDKVVARFYYVKNGTFYSTYKSYDGILATY